MDFNGVVRGDQRIVGDADDHARQVGIKRTAHGAFDDGGCQAGGFAEHVDEAASGALNDAAATFQVEGKHPLVFCQCPGTVVVHQHIDHQRWFFVDGLAGFDLDAFAVEGGALQAHDDGVALVEIDG
ncbi:hypothetical protein [Pseudomonas glycinae]|uniref:Uncharacterized protein n=1 Tax=Pseudomonas glycinae TaxID=1785145 RepID=A0ABM6QI43_9PSED|nr:hypothetical protein [Pseudomonas glycinae]AUG97438.1 hypothetical protein AWU82_28660 [Pseudomonas glycinae]